MENVIKEKAIVITSEEDFQEYISSTETVSYPSPPLATMSMEEYEDGQTPS